MTQKKGEEESVSCVPSMSCNCWASLMAKMKPAVPKNDRSWEQKESEEFYSLAMKNLILTSLVDFETFFVFSWMLFCLHMELIPFCYLGYKLHPTLNHLLFCFYILQNSTNEWSDHKVYFLFLFGIDTYWGISKHSFQEYCLVLVFGQMSCLYVEENNCSLFEY